MELCMLFRRGAEMVAPKVAYEEQEEDIGSPSESASRNSAGSSASSSEVADDASSSSSSVEHFEMSSLMTQLPFKRGLSSFFDGKSQSFASLAAVGSLEDLAKPPRKRLNPSRSCGGDLDAHRGRFLSPRRHCPRPPEPRRRPRGPSSRCLAPRRGCRRRPRRHLRGRRGWPARL